MRQIGVLEETPALRFTSYLVTLGIDSHTEPEPNGWLIWVKDENSVEHAKEELAAFRENPTAEKYVLAEVKAREILIAEEKKRLQASENIIEIRGQWKAPGASARTRRRCPLVWVLIGLSFVVSFYINFGNSQPPSLAFRALQFKDPIYQLDAANGETEDSPAFRLSDVLNGEVWRLVTPTFVHLGVWHLVGNVVMLWYLGGQVETRYGTVRFGYLVLALALASSILQGLAPVEWGGSPFGGGLSGVVYGIFGFMWVKMMLDANSSFYMSGFLIVLMLGWFLFGVFNEVSGGMVQEANIANWAHGGGLATGMLIAYLLSQRQPPQ